MLGHLRDMLAEKEQDIAMLQTRLRNSEAMHGEALSRLEGLEVRLGVARSNGCAENWPDPGATAAGKSKGELQTQLSHRIEALERLVNKQGVHTVASPAPAVPGVPDKGIEALERRVFFLEQIEMDAAVADKLRVAQQHSEILARKLEESQSEHCSAIQQANRWRVEAEALQKKLADLSKSVGEARESAAAASAREFSALHAKLAQSVSQASVLRSQLKSREADVHRLECRVAELQGWGPAATGGRLDSIPFAANANGNGSSRQSSEHALRMATPPPAMTGTGLTGRAPAAAVHCNSGAASPGSGGSWTPPPRSQQFPNIAMGPNTARASPQHQPRVQSAILVPPTTVSVGAVPDPLSGRVSRASSQDPRIQRDQSPQAMHHVVTNDGVTMLVQRSQSLPVHGVVSAQSSPARPSPGSCRGAFGAAASLAHWAGSPAVGTRQGSEVHGAAAAGAPGLRSARNAPAFR